MSTIVTGGIDCDIHPAVPNLKALHPYLSDHWRDIIVQRGVQELNSISYPANAPITARPDWRVDGHQARLRPGTVAPACAGPVPHQHRHRQLPVWRATAVQRGHGRRLRPRGERLDGGEWLDKEPRLRASIVVPVQNPEMAVDEINRVAPDKRFVQVLMLVMDDMPLGKRHYWPIYAAAAEARPGRSASTPAAPIAIRSRRSDGRPITPRTTPLRPPASSRRCRR